MIGFCLVNVVHVSKHKGVGTAAAGAAMATPLFDHTKIFFIHLGCRRSTVNSRLLTRSVSDAQITVCSAAALRCARARVHTYVPSRIYAFRHAVASRLASRSCACKKVVLLILQSQVKSA